MLSRRIIYAVFRNIRRRTGGPAGGTESPNKPPNLPTAGENPAGVTVHLHTENELPYL